MNQTADPKPIRSLAARWPILVSLALLGMLLVKYLAKRFALAEVQPWKPAKQLAILLYKTNALTSTFWRDKI